MRYQRVLADLLGFAMCCVIAAGKEKILLLTDVLRAKTVPVVIDPDAGVSPEIPQGESHRVGERREGPDEVVTV